MTNKLRIFISSSMVEFAEERQMIKAALEDLLHDAWLFEMDAGARPETVEQAFIEEVENSDIYLGLFWQKYGEYTIQEYGHARNVRKPCLVYQREIDQENRDPKLKKFLKRVNNVRMGVSTRWFSDNESLVRFVCEDVQNLQARVFRKQQAARGQALKYKPGEKIIGMPDEIFGRGNQKAKLLAYLDEGQHVLLTGYGGIGKSVLAMSVARHYLDTANKPVIWMSADYLNADGIFESLAQLLGARQELAMHIGKSRIQKMAFILAASEVGLLVLDDVRNLKAVADVRAAMPENLPLLITSRYDLGNIHKKEIIMELSPVDAMNMLANHAQNERWPIDKYHSDPQSSELCRKLGYHPLGIKIAGKWMANRKRKPTALLARIAQKELTPSSIIMPESFAQEGQQSVMIVLDEMFYEVSELAQALFDVFAALFIPRASISLLAEFLEGVSIYAIEDALDELESWNLVSMEVDDFYRMHDMVHDFARTMNYGLDKPDLSPTITRIVRFIQENSGNHDQLGLNMINIVAAAQTAFEIDDHLNMVEIIHKLADCEYFDFRGISPDQLDLLDKGIEILRQDDEKNKSKLHLMLCKRGNAHVNRGDLEDGFEFYQEAFETAPNNAAKIRLLGGMGKVCMMQKRNDRADDYFKSAYALIDPDGKLNVDDLNIEEVAVEDLKALSRVMEQHCYAAFIKNDFETVRELAKSGIGITKKIGDQIGEGWFRINLGAAKFEMGVREAISFYQDAEKIALAVRDYSLEAKALFNIGIAYHALEDFQNAKDYLKRAKALYKDINFLDDEKDVAGFLEQFGYTLPE